MKKDKSVSLLFLLHSPFHHLLFFFLLVIHPLGLIQGKFTDSLSKCDYSKGKWIRKEGLNHLHYSGNCSFLDYNWACQKHKRKNFEYLNYEWRPYDCDLIRFDSLDFLNRMRNKRIGFVGDSIGRQNYQSLLCLLAGDTTRPKIPHSKIKPVGIKLGFSQGSKKVKLRNKWAYLFEDFNVTVFFSWSSVLCHLEKYYATERGEQRVAMHLDRPDGFFLEKWESVDVLVMNTGGHWNIGKIKHNKWDFFINNTKTSLHGFNNNIIHDALNLTVHTLTHFIQSRINQSQKNQEKYPLVIFRTLAANHFMGGEWNSGGKCHHIHHVFDSKEIQGRLSRDRFVENAVQTTDVALLNITYLTQFRGDSHPATLGRLSGAGAQDCLHWCLPGVPDVWNQILHSYIIEWDEQNKKAKYY